LRADIEKKIEPKKKTLMSKRKNKNKNKKTSAKLYSLS